MRKDMQTMAKDLFCLALPGILLAAVFASPASAGPVCRTGWCHSFGNTSTGAGTTQMGSPHGSSNYRNVVSKYNQPRNVGAQYSNPHQGTDLQSTVGTTVYALWDGWVVDIRNCQVSGDCKCELDMYIDLNRDGLRNDNLHVRFDHLSSIRSSLRVGDRITKGQWVASTGDENGEVFPHLHFGLRKDLQADGVADVWIRNEPYYRHVSSWDWGRRLDFISLSTWTNGSQASVFCYAYDETGYEGIPWWGATFFARPVGGSAWTAYSPVKAGDRWYVDFWRFFSSGQQIEWMARCNRSSTQNAGNPIYWAFHPPKYAQPVYDPNSTWRRYDYFTNTVQ